jgi:hypothetical protein
LRPEPNAFPQREGHLLARYAQIEPRHFERKRGVIPILVPQSEHLATRHAIMIRKAIDMAEPLRSLRNRFKRKEHRSCAKRLEPLTGL